MVLIFDLDDTLYEEITYVRSGFRAVAELLQQQNSAISADTAFAEMLGILQAQGRGKVFDGILQQYGIWSKKQVKACLSAYRLHQPNIALPDVSIRCLQRFADCPKYIITDGNKEVQQRKVAALGVEKYVKKALLTSRYGLKNAKPSPYCFLKIANWERTAPSQIVYIGDNPNKDFVKIKPLGFRTVRIRAGMFANLTKSSEFEADIEIHSLDELNPNILL